MKSSISLYKKISESRWGATLDRYVESVLAKSVYVLGDFTAVLKGYNTNGNYTTEGKRNQNSWNDCLDH